MKSSTSFICEFAVTCKFRTPLFCGPLFTALQQLRGNALVPMAFEHKDAFQVADRAAFHPFDIVMPELALGKPHRKCVIESQKESRFLIRKYSFNFFCKSVNELSGQRRMSNRVRIIKLDNSAFLINTSSPWVDNGVLRKTGLIQG